MRAYAAQTRAGRCPGCPGCTTPAAHRRALGRGSGRRPGYPMRRRGEPMEPAKGAHNPPRCRGGMKPTRLWQH
eukprot:scaffold10814_cov112-Isochrysis_galbana.AAC.5